MTATDEIAKDFRERDLERLGATQLWGRTWKADLILSLKTEHARLCEIHASNLKRFPDVEAANPQAAEQSARVARVAFDMLRETRELMLTLALHPTRPKAERPSMGGGRPRKTGPVHDAELVPMPRPEAVGPEPAPADDPQPPL